MKNYDVIVIGGGPAGMMAAGRAGELGARVLLLEKNPNLGVKLLITGKERCNITNDIDNTKDLVAFYGDKGKFLFSSIHKFGVKDIKDFFEGKGVKLKTERGNRVFPESDIARDVLKAIIGYLKESRVEIKTGQEVMEFIQKGNEIEKIILGSGKELRAKKYIVCTGGKSYPLTGSTGQGYNWLEKMGHKIVRPVPALTPVIAKEGYIKDLEGLSLKNVEISIYTNDKKQDTRFGEAIFTSNGMSGPVIIDMSKKIGEIMAQSPEIRIDFKPALSWQELDKRVQKDFQENNNKAFKNCLDRLLPKKLIPVIIKLSRIDPEKKVNLVTHDERKALLHLLKEFKLMISRLDGFEKAIITAGGVDLTQVDPQTMQSKIIDNLYLAGEVLDIDGPTGGFNLQVCWSTGFTAGEGVV